MKNKEFWSDWLLTFMALFMFATLLATLLSGMGTLSWQQLLSCAVSPLAYSLMLTGMFIGSRPRFLEKHFGMPKMYEIHAIMTLVALILATGHIAFYWQGLGAMFRSPAAFWGYIGYFGIWGGFLSGMLSLSSMFIKQSKFLMNLKLNVFNREVMLWIHRISAIAAILGTYMQSLSIPFLRANTAYIGLLTFYTVLIVGYFLWWKLEIAREPKYRVKSIERGTPTLWVLEFEPVNGRIKDYHPGDYFFIRFQGDVAIGKEPHPFSTSSAQTKQFPNSIQFMIKDAGDWTEQLKNVKVGDIATLEGPYGDFYPEEVRREPESTPFILLGGGIGLTPNLSLLRSEIEKGSQREIHLYWGLSLAEDLFMVEELESYRKVNPNFHYHIVFSIDEVPGYGFGFITDDLIRETAGARMYTDAHFFVCGPGPMLNATRKILDDNNVPFERKHIDDFDF
ncbi:hypothetical protein CL176_03055 [Suicoccus acidiformans]|uniref:FAD-binding FR-type domain-containing protein n=1 Tax=Suicoccus acidiformans TaxID=2036206 RepID=A0A347WJ31_9LACT|nr:hypothetical protein [Suicoccus acidiformans]AXY25088.1 hypothetical protein CL176_03055 [Suicoccus acidiformans]